MKKKLEKDTKKETKISKKNNYIDDYMNGVVEICNQLDRKDMQNMIKELAKLKKRDGRLFLLGVGGSAANCSHAVNDFRKIANIETYAPTDNVSELTARANDDGWDTIFSNWLKGSRLKKKDAILVYSVGGGNVQKNISTNIVSALQYAKKTGSTILGIVSRDGGYTKKVADVCVLIPVVSDELITPYAEAFQGVIWHMCVFAKELRN